MRFPDLKVIIFIEFIEQQQFMGIVQNICCGQKQIQKKRAVKRLVTKDLAKQLQNDSKNIYQSTNASGDSLPNKEQSEINYYSMQVEQRSQFSQKNYYEIGDFQVLGQLGFGSFGKVYLVAKKEQSHLAECEKYALKRIDRKSFSNQKNEQYTKLEKHILTNIKHPFLTNLKFSFSDSYYVYLILQWASGGSAQSLLSFKHSLKKKPRASRFKELGEDGVRFIAACVVLGLEELHGNGIMYRDLKPENVLLFADGYAKLTDFGLAKVVEEDQVSKTEAGTVIYFAPEIALRMGYSKLVDLWTLGIFLYELSTCETPFRQDEIRTRVTFKQKVLASQKHRNWKNFNFSEDLKDIINKLLKYDPTTRLGVNGYDQIKSHQFFRTIDWDKLLKKELQSPLKKLLQQFPTKIMAVKKSKSVKVIEPLTHSNTYQQWHYDYNPKGEKKIKEI